MDRVRRAMATAAHQAAQAPPAPQEKTDARVWWLEGYIKKDRVHRSTCAGDPALNEAIHGLEARHPGVRLKVWLA